MVIDNLINQIEVVLGSLYKGNNEADREIVKMIDLLIEFEKNSNCKMQELNVILEKALESVKYRDMVSMCDVLEYDLLPFIKQSGLMES